MVVIRPDADYIDKDGIVVDFSMREATVRGAVVSFTDTPCSWKKVQDLMDKGGYVRQMRAAWLRSRSVEFDAPFDIKIGDRVFFSYLSRFCETYNNHWIVDNDMLICKDDMTPLNGYVLFEVDEHKDDSWFMFYNEDKNNYGQGTVKHVGAKINYLDSTIKSDLLEVSVGDRIVYNKKSAVRLEDDLFNTTTKRQSSLFRIHRKDIWLLKN